MLISDEDADSEEDIGWYLVIKEEETKSSVINDTLKSDNAEEDISSKLFETAEPSDIEINIR